MLRLLPILLLSLLIGCALEPTMLDEVSEETGVAEPFGAVPDEGAADQASSNGPSVSAGSATEVWPVTNAWADTDTAAAQEAGLAWGANSGLDWEAKFARWVSSFELVDRDHGSGQSFKITTPYGDRSFNAPTLECAEVSFMLRAVFASWYHLPFYMRGWDSKTRQSIYAGHFGFIYRNGSRVARFPNFRSSYRDYEDSWTPGQDWPSDSRLRAMHLADDDGIAFLLNEQGEQLGAGAYFDEILLNKRVGYFLRLLLLYFGSTNLADSNNTFHVKAEAIRAGDTLLMRWQRRGIGHVIPVMRVNEVAEGSFEVSVASGSMPRRQPLWEDPSIARTRFTSEDAGGPGENYDGDSFASLGGGLRRWRTAVLSRGRWRNEVREADREAYINSDDHAAIAARVERFGEILASLSPEQRRDAALSQINLAREHLAQYPASCAARTRREDAFEQLYTVMEEDFGQSRADVDNRYRTLADYVFAELEYTQSRTCCWNRSTDKMAEIIMSYAEQEQNLAEEQGMCVAPTVFRAEVQGYDRWRSHADSLGRVSDWRAWSEDESCSQRGVREDSVAERGGQDFCSLSPVDPSSAEGAEASEGPTGEEAVSCDPASADDMMSSAGELALGVTHSARICESDRDWYHVEAEGDVTVTLSFSNAEGDLDIVAYGPTGSEIGRSASVNDEEVLTLSGEFYLEVYGYDGAANSYTLRVE